MFSLFPKDENFFELFRRQAALVREGCDQLDEMMREVRPARGAGAAPSRTSSTRATWSRTSCSSA